MDESGAARDPVTEIQRFSRINYEGLYRPPNVRIEAAHDLLRIAAVLGPLTLALALGDSVANGVLIAFVGMILWFVEAEVLRVVIYEIEQFRWSTAFFRARFRNRNLIRPGLLRTYSVLIRSTSARATIFPVFLAVSGVALLGLVVMLLGGYVFASTAWTIVLIVTAAGFLSTIIGELATLLAPPGILLLAASGEPAKRLQAHVYYSVRVIRTVALIDLEGVDCGLRSHNIRLGGKRSDWRVAVHELMAIAGVIVIDVRNLTDFVREELSMLAEPERRKKTIVVVDTDLAHDVLPGAQRVRAEEAAAVVRARIEREGFRFHAFENTFHLSRAPVDSVSID